MDNEIRISDAEWKALEVVWKTPGITIGRIRTALDGNGWHYSTIKTLVLRLVKKGALYTDESDNIKHYYAAIKEDEIKESETRSFLKRVYNGSFKQMMSCVSQMCELSKTELDEIMKIVDKIDRKMITN